MPRLKLELPKTAEELEKAFLDPILRNAFFLAKVPSLAFFGAAVSQLDRRACRIELPFSWRSQNPFNSIYFAAQSAAAELSTGALVLRAMASLGMGPAEMSMLVVSMEAKFGKKAKSLTTFECLNGEEIHQAAERAKNGEDVIVKAETVGRMKDGTEVSRFTFVWALKAKPASGTT